MDDERAPLKAESFVINDSKRGRPKKRWKESIKKDMLAKGFKKK